MLHYKLYRDLSPSTYAETGTTVLYGQNNQWQIDRSTDTCEHCRVRTTLVIDDELYRRAKVKAVLEGRTVTELVEAGLRAVLASSQTVERSRPPRPVRLRKSGPLTLEALETAIQRGRD